VDRHDLTGALDAFAGGVERRIDTAEVNGRLFLNNVSLGIYGDAVRSPADNPAVGAWLALTRRAALQPGETLLVLGATGASGRIAVALAGRLGAPGSGWWRSGRWPALPSPCPLRSAQLRGWRSSAAARVPSRWPRSSPPSRRSWPSPPSGDLPIDIDEVPLAQVAAAWQRGGGQRIVLRP
jgi:hypothetical protein